MLSSDLSGYVEGEDRKECLQLLGEMEADPRFDHVNESDAPELFDQQRMGCPLRIDLPGNSEARREVGELQLDFPQSDFRNHLDCVGYARNANEIRYFRCTEYDLESLRASPHFSQLVCKRLCRAANGIWEFMVQMSASVAIALGFIEEALEESLIEEDGDEEFAFA